jgi:hypothetical protein
MLPSKDQLTICFAHVAYRLRERFLALATGIESFEVRDGAALEQRIGKADVLVISGLWRNDLLPRAKRLAFHPVDRCWHRPVLARVAQAARSIPPKYAVSQVIGFIRAKVRSTLLASMARGNAILWGSTSGRGDTSSRR